MSSDTLAYRGSNFVCAKELPAQARVANCGGVPRRTGQRPKSPPFAGLANTSA
jgi:hypothetical protein